MGWTVLALVVLALMPYVAIAPTKLSKTYDNRLPRASYGAMEGLAARALAAHQNCLEAFPPFAVAVVLALVLGVSEPLLSILVWGFVGLRVLYVVCYYKDWADVRSLVWLAAFLVQLVLYGFVSFEAFF